MSLSNFQKEIFYTFVRYHILTRKPLGSKILSKKLKKKKLASSTLRLYLRQLASYGYLENTSDFSGRIPTDKGWYFYLLNYELKPEIKIPSKITFNDLETISDLTKNVVFCGDGYSLRVVVKGLRHLINESDDKQAVADILNIIDSLDKILTRLEKLTVWVGNDFDLSETKNLSLIAFKDERRIFGFLGHKINYYHANLSLIKKLFEDDKQK